MLRKIAYYIIFFVCFTNAVYQLVDIQNTSIFFDMDTQDRTLILNDNNQFIVKDILDYVVQDLNYIDIDTLLSSANDQINIIILYQDNADTFGYTYQIELARTRIAKERYPNFFYQKNVTLYNIHNVISNLVQENYQIIIGTSSDHAYIYEIYYKYPNITFALSNYPNLYNLLKPNANNLILYNILPSLMGTRYITGILSGYKQNNEKICFVSPGSNPLTIQMILYYYLGIYSICPSCELYVNVINTYSNQSLEIEALNHCVETNTSVISYHTNNPYIPKGASSLNIYSIGYQQDLRILYGENILTSIITNWYNILYNIISLAQENEASTFTILNSNNDLVLSPLSLKVNTSIKSKINQLIYTLQSNNLSQFIEQDCNVFNCTQLEDVLNTNYFNTKKIIVKYIYLPNITNIYIYPSFEQDIIVIILFIIGICILMGIIFNLLVIFIYKNNQDIIKRKPIFLACQNIGCIILILSVFLMIGYPTYTNCYLQLIFIVIGFDLFYLPFLVKALRLYILFNAQITTTISIKDWILITIIVSFLFIDCFILLAWFILNPISIDSVLSNQDYLTNYYYLSCNPNKGFLIGIIIYKTILCSIVWIITDLASQIVFKIKSFSNEQKKNFKKINDAIDIKFGITFTFILLICVLMVLLVIQTNPINNFIAIAITIYIAISVPQIRIMYSIVQDLFTNKVDLNKGKNTSNTQSGRENITK